MIDTTTGTLQDYVERNRLQPGEGLGSFTSRRYQQAARHLPKRTLTILDVGCNVGVAAGVLRRAAPNARLFALDCVPERIQEARRVFDVAVEGTATALPWPDASMCAVIAGELIEHLTTSDAVRFVEETRRVLRPGGRLILTTPNPEYVRLRLSGRSVLDDVAHLSQFAANELRALVEKHGFCKTRVEGTGRVSTFIGCRFPFLSMYGSYMLVSSRVAVGSES